MRRQLSPKRVAAPCDASLCGPRTGPGSAGGRVLCRLLPAPLRQTGGHCWQIIAGRAISPNKPPKDQTNFLSTTNLDEFESARHTECYGTRGHIMISSYFTKFCAPALFFFAMYTAFPNVATAQSPSDPNWLDWDQATRRCAISDLLARNLQSNTNLGFNDFSPNILRRGIEAQGRFRVVFGEVETVGDRKFSRIISVEVVEVTSSTPGGDAMYRSHIERSLKRHRISGEAASKCVSGRSAEVGFSSAFDGEWLITSFTR